MNYWWVECNDLKINSVNFYPCCRRNINLLPNGCWCWAALSFSHIYPSVSSASINSHVIMMAWSFLHVELRALAFWWPYSYYSPFYSSIVLWVVPRNEKVAYTAMYKPLQYKIFPRNTRNVITLSPLTWFTSCVQGNLWEMVEFNGNIWRIWLHSYLRSRIMLQLASRTRIRNNKRSFCVYFSKIIALLT